MTARPWRVVMVRPLMLAQHELASREAASRAVSCVIEEVLAAAALLLLQR